MGITLTISSVSITTTSTGPPSKLKKFSTCFWPNVHFIFVIRGGRRERKMAWSETGLKVLQKTRKKGQLS